MLAYLIFHTPELSFYHYNSFEMLVTLTNGHNAAPQMEVPGFNMSFHFSADFLPSQAL
jgi:hypothetical protein